jgi:HSP20 family protein
MKAITGIGHELRQGWQTLAEGWNHLREKASSALTRFAREEPSHRYDAWTARFPEAGPLWGIVAGEVFEDATRVVVQVEAPGMESSDFDVRVAGRLLTVRGNKRSSHESDEGHYRVIERAYGTFERTFELPDDVLPDRVSATYRRGVLTVELPKARLTAPRRVQVSVH